MTKPPRPSTRLLRIDPEMEDAKVFLMMILLADSRYSLLPELLRIAGTEVTQQLLATFGGAVLRFPSEEEIEKAAKDVDIFVRLERQKGKPTGNGSAIVARMAEEYSRSPSHILATYKQMREVFGELYDAWRGRKDA